jgi:hypothetical protein
LRAIWSRLPLFTPLSTRRLGGIRPADIPTQGPARGNDSRSSSSILNSRRKQLCTDAWHVGHFMSISRWIAPLSSSFALVTGSRPPRGPIGLAGGWGRWRRPAGRATFQRVIERPAVYLPLVCQFLFPKVRLRSETYLLVAELALSDSVLMKGTARPSVRCRAAAILTIAPLHPALDAATYLACLRKPNQSASPRRNRRDPKRHPSS